MSRRVRRLMLLGAAAISLILSVTLPAGDATAAAWVQIDSQAHSAPIMRLAVAVSRDLVVTTSDDKTARLWSLNTGRALSVLRPPVGPGRAGRLFGAAIHPTQDLVAIAGSGSASLGPPPSIWLFEISTGRLKRSISARGEHVRRLAWSTDGEILLACYAEPGAIRAFGLSGDLLYEETLGGDCLALDTQGGRLAAATRNNAVHLYRIENHAVVRTGRFGTEADPLAVDFSPDGTRLVVGFYTTGAGSSVYRVDTGARILRLATPTDVLTPRGTDPISTTQAVAWSADGRVIHTAGVFEQTGQVQGRVRRFDATSGAFLADQSVSEDTVTDLVALPGGAPGGSSAVAWASFAGDWGVTRDESNAVRAAPRVEFLIRRGVAELMVSPNGRAVRWRRGTQRLPVSFEIPSRSLGTGATAGLRAAVTRGGISDTAQNFVNSFQPSVRNTTIALAVGEISRALTYVGNEGHVVLATDLGIRRLDRSLNVVWQARTATEVRAVNATDDGTLLVTTMTDGTVRWWRADDGTLLLSLLATRDGWVLWSPTGHYDASLGAESLIGWLVDRDDGSPIPDHFTVARFRERFNRPDVIDRILDLRDPAEALSQADAARGQSSGPLAQVYRPSTQTNQMSVAIPPAPSPSAPPIDLIQLSGALTLPPVLGALEPLLVAATAGPHTFRFTMRASTPSAVRLEVRLDGKLTDVQHLSLPVRLDGSLPGEVTVKIVPGVETVQLVARAGHLASEPLRFKLDGSRPRIIEPLRRNGTLYVLAIGVSKYRDPRIELQLPAKDARDFANSMQQQRGVLYSDIVARVLTDGEATRDNVMQGLAWLREQPTADDVGLLFLAGHGVNDRSGRYHFLPSDVDLLRLDATSIADTAIATTLNSLRGRAVLFMDTCYAGSVADTLANVSRENARFANGLSSPENLVSVFASSTGRQESLELDAWGNGAFTKIAIEGLKGGARLTALDVVTSRSLSPYLAEGVSRLTAGRQTPVSVIPDVMPDRILSRLETLPIPTPVERLPQ